MTTYTVNAYGFEEKYLGVKTVKVTNNLGRTALLDEIVYLDGWLGEVLETAGIANGAEGQINIDFQREVKTAQINAAATFVVGNTVYFKPGSSSVAGTLESSSTLAYAIGKITAFGGSAGAHTWVQYKPYLQKADVGDHETRVLALEANAVSAQATIPVPLNAISQEDGTALTKQASTTAGFAQLANKEVVIDIPVNCSAGENLQFSVPVPQDLDDTEDITVHVLAGKAADLDELTLDCEVFPCAAGDTANADIQDTAAQAITQAASELVFTCGADGVLAAPGTLTVVLALGGTNDGDAVYIYGVWIEYTKKIMTA